MQGERKDDFRVRLKRLRERSKASFTKGTMEDLIRKLREGNEDLERLSKQVQTLSESNQKSPAADNSTLSHCNKVQRVSSKLH